MSTLCVSPAKTPLPTTPTTIVRGLIPSAQSPSTCSLPTTFGSAPAYWRGKPPSGHRTRCHNHSPEKDHTGYSSTDTLGIRWTNQYPTALPRQTDKDSDYIWQLTGMPYNTAYNAPSADVDERLRVLNQALPNGWPVESSSFSGDYDVRYFLFVLARRLQAHNTVQPTETPVSREYRLKSQTHLNDFKAQIEKTLLETYGAVVKPADAETPSQYTLTFQRKIQAGAFLKSTLSTL